MVIFLFILSCAIPSETQDQASDNLSDPPISDESWKFFKKTLKLLRVIDETIENATIRITHLESLKLPVLKRLIDLDDVIERTMKSKAILEGFAQERQANKEASDNKEIEVRKIRKIHLESVKLPLLEQFRSLDNAIERTKIRITHLESVKLQFTKLFTKDGGAL